MKKVIGSVDFSAVDKNTKKVIATLVVIVLIIMYSISSIEEKSVEQNKSRETFKVIVNPTYFGDKSNNEAGSRICSFDCVEPDSFTKETMQNKSYYVHKLLNGDYCYVKDNEDSFVLVICFANYTVRININWVPDQIFEWNNSIYLKDNYDLYCVDLQNREVCFFMSLSHSSSFSLGSVYTQGNTLVYNEGGYLYIINDKETVKRKTNSDCIGIISDESVLMCRFFAGFELIYEYNFQNHLIKKLILCEAIGGIMNTALSPDKNYLLYTVSEGFEDAPPTLRLIDLETRERLILDSMDNELWKISSLQFI
ncbi:MAG: hypothetical protein ACI4GC_00695 [Acutalibacteraceae bacterium]